MTKLLVQEFLETHSFQDLITEHGVYASVSKNHKKVSLNYDSVVTKESDILAHDCRGLILCKSDHYEFPTLDNGKLDLLPIVGNTDIVCFPMRRFFNYGQGAAADIDFTNPNVSIQCKYDGTCTLIYLDPMSDQWCVATRSVPDADLLMDNGLFTFAQLFHKAAKETSGMDFDQFTSYLDKDVTYCFELTTPLNEIVVRHHCNSIMLLAARNIKTFQELNPSTICIPNVPHVKTYQHMSVAELVEWVSTFDPSQFEGVVVCDDNFNRIKVKNAQYVLAHKMRDTIAASTRNCLEIILHGREDDILPLLPQEIKESVISMKRKFRTWLAHEEWKYGEMLAVANAIKPNDKKTFALTLQKYNIEYRAAYFSIYDGKASSVKDFIEKQKREGAWSNNVLDKILDGMENTDEL